MRENTVLVNDHYQISLPLKDTDIKLPNNRKQTEKQLEGLEKRFKRNQKFFQQYEELMYDIIGNGYTEKCKIQGKEGRIWYLLHPVCTTHKNLKKIGWCLIVVYPVCKYVNQQRTDVRTRPS